MRRAVHLALIILFSVLSCLAADRGTHINISGRDVAVWKPSGATPKTGFPVIIFSHGFGGCNTQSTFLMEALAQDGYLVVAPNHADARCGTARAAGRSRPKKPFRSPDQWSDATYHDRQSDIRVVLDAVFASKTFEGVSTDPNHVGIAGHSLGGYTALGVGGAWPSWRDKRFKAVHALSPFCTPYSQKGDLPHLGIPVMYQGGTRDYGISPTVKKFDGAFALSSKPRYYIELDGAGHFAWTDLNPRFQPLINQYSLAFFDHYLKVNGSDTLTPLLKKTSTPGISLIRYDDSEQ